MNDIGITFDDITLVPQLNEVRSRSEVNLETTLGINRPLRLKLPLISAPMDTVSSAALAALLSDRGGLCILHRYSSVDEQVSQVTKARELAARKSEFQIGAAVGATGDYLERTAALVQAGVAAVCVDVAHGHSLAVKECIQAIRTRYPGLHIMAGNIATAQAYDYLVAAGADSLRVSIGSGSCCETRVNTGHGLPALHSVMDVVSNAQERLPNVSGPGLLPAGVILDGGIRNPGDIVKSLAVGAHAVMMGSMFAGTDEAPGKRIVVNGKEKAVFRGMASAESQLEWRGFVGSEEGTSHYVDPKGPASVVVDKIVNGIRSGFTYSGARDLADFHKKAKFVKQTISGLVEGRPHIRF
jgi:IMP dehydrogenase